MKLEISGRSREIFLDMNSRQKTNDTNSCHKLSCMIGDKHGQPNQFFLWDCVGTSTQAWTDIIKMEFVNFID
jgi:hypothetical protein